MLAFCIKMLPELQRKHRFRTTHWPVGDDMAFSEHGRCCGDQMAKQDARPGFFPCGFLLETRISLCVPLQAIYIL